MKQRKDGENANRAGTVNPSFFAVFKDMGERIIGSKLEPPTQQESKIFLAKNLFSIRKHKYAIIRLI